MRVVMTVQRVLQDAGRELILRQGETYDLPAPVADALLATLAAKPADGHPRPDEGAPAPPEE